MVRILVLVVLLSLVLSACSPNGSSFQQEPVTDATWLPSPSFENPLSFGSSLHDRPELRDQAAAYVASCVGGRLPGVRFLVVRYPVWEPDLRINVSSYRVPGPDAYAVFGWFEDAQGFHVVNVPFEVEHLVAGTDDYGNQLSGGVR